VSNVQYSIISNGEDEFVTAIFPGASEPLVASKSGNSRFDTIVAALRSNGIFEENEIRDLFSVAQAVAEKFESISDRVIVSGGTVLFDGAAVDNSLTKQIVRFLDEGNDFQPLVNFLEKVQDNPNEHSRTQLFDWLDQRDFTIDWTGNIVAYKGVAGSEGDYKSISSGSEPVFVEVGGETVRHNGRIPNPVGSIISMDRNLVQHDPSVGCHVGLHVGTYDYAKSFSHGTVLEVHVNPRDVVSVPTECDWAKVRTCRYEVVDAIDEPYSSGLLDPDGYRDEDDAWEDFDY